MWIVISIYILHNCPLNSRDIDRSLNREAASPRVDIAALQKSSLLQ